MLLRKKEFHAYHDKLIRMRFAGLLLMTAAAYAADRFPVDWTKVNAELMGHYTALLRIDTSNPPGNETTAANYVKGVLDREGIASEMFALDPARANLVARLKGNGSKRPLVVMGHLDVVGVQRDKWTVDPFAGIIKDGYIYGRGASDDKGMLAANIAVFLRLHREKVQLDRDIILLAEAGEEGTPKYGIEYMIELADYYTKTSTKNSIGFFQLGGGIAGDFPICVVPMLHQDLQRTNVPLWGYFCQISDSTTSFGSYSGAVPNEKITWGKLGVDTPSHVIESDASIVAPLMFAYVLGW